MPIRDEAKRKRITKRPAWKGRAKYRAESKGRGLVTVAVNMPHSMADMFYEIAREHRITVSHAVVVFVLESLEQ